MPYIGSIKQLPHTYFALGYGGNGITYSRLAAEILCDLLMEKANKDAEIHSFERKKSWTFNSRVKQIPHRSKLKRDSQKLR